MTTTKTIYTVTAHRFIDGRSEAAQVLTDGKSTMSFDTLAEAEAEADGAYEVDANGDQLDLGDDVSIEIEEVEVDDADETTAAE